MANLYTSSRLKVLGQCLRLHLYRYVLGIQTPSSPEAEFGTVAHKGIERWLLAWKRGDLEARLPAMLAVVQDSELHPFAKARLAALLTAYHFRWHAQPWEVLAVEAEFRYELAGHTIGGKIDAIIRRTDTGEIWIVEHKSTARDASPGSGYWAALSIDNQISIYIDGATMLGYEVAGVIYDVLKRPKHEPRMATPAAEREYTQGKGCKTCGGSAKPGAIEKGRGFKIINFVGVNHVECEDCDGTGWKKDKNGKPEAPRLVARQRETDETLDEFTDRLIDEIAGAPDDFLIRGEVVRLDDELPTMRADLLSAIKLEQASTLFDLHPRNPDACHKFGSACHFFGVCSGRADINDEHMFPRGSAHPELAAA